MRRYQSISIRGIVFSALFAALLAIMSFVSFHLPISPVPITLENMAVMLAGGILGARYGFFSMMVVLVLVAFGVPLLHGQGGIGLIVGYTGGYIWAWPICALLTGLIVPRLKGNGLWTIILAAITLYVFGDLISYIPGSLWLAHVNHLRISTAFQLGAYPFFIGDALKAVVSAIIVVAVKAVFPVSRIVGKSTSSVVPLTTYTD